MRPIIVVLALSLLQSSGLGIRARQSSEKLLLQSTEMILARVRISEARIGDAAVSSNGEDLYLLTDFSRTLLQVRGKEEPKKIAIFPRGVASLAIGAQGWIYLADSAAGEVKILNSEGRKLFSFIAPRPESLAVLSDGRVVVASTLADRLLHLFDKKGHKLKSFAKLRNFSGVGDAQRRFMNRGKVLTDAADNIYFVSLGDPNPVVRKFSSEGEYLLDFPISGEAVSLQSGVAKEFLRNRTERQIGGIRVINTAVIDQSSETLWIGLLGSSGTSVLYEYDLRGTKLREYRLVLNAGKAETGLIIGVNHLIARHPMLTVFANQGVYRFNVLERSTAEILPMSLPPCPAKVPWPSCVTPCGTESASEDDIDCKSILETSVNLNGQKVINSSCDNGPLYCSATVTLCNEQTSAVTTHSTEAITCGSGGSGLCLENSSTNFGIVCQSPLLLDVSGNGFDLTNASNGVNFDIDGDGVSEKISWTSAGGDDGWLWLDRNGNGFVDNGTELFGNFTPQPASANPNGFLALAEYDRQANGGNGDGVIDQKDAIYSSLRLWQDRNHNGISEPDESHLLTALGLSSLDLRYKESRRQDRHGNWFRYRAKVRDTNSFQMGRWAYDVFLLRED